MCREDGKGCDGSALQSTKVGDKIVNGSSRKESKGYTKHWYREYLKNRYDWNVDSAFTENELKTIRGTANAIESYVDGLTYGLGQEWMGQYLGSINLWKNRISIVKPSLSLPGNIILEANWINHATPGHWLAHELGHTWDLRSSGNPLAMGGVGDKLNTYIGGSIASSLALRFMNPGYPENGGPVPVDSHIPYDMRYIANRGYGNGATSDYLAEGFAFSAYSQSANIPSGVQDWIGNEIGNQALLMVAPSEWYGIGTR